MHAEEARLFDALGVAPGGWSAAWACSTARKGYSGVATLWADERLRGARCEPMSVDAADEADLEGRVLRLDVPLTSSAAELTIVNVYTPNSGAALTRLPYRTGPGGWDDKFREAVLSARAAPGGGLCVAGDLNVAVEDVDFYNPAEKRTALQAGTLAMHTRTCTCPCACVCTALQAGTTPEERRSMRETLRSLSDAFRTRHPHSAGQYTYWSQRARNRPRNRGLRIDYFLVGGIPDGAIVDVQLLRHLHGSDHCPLLMELDLDQV